MKIDLHIHSKYSAGDGVLEPQEIILIARRKGLNGIAVTDHNTIRGGEETRKYETENFSVIVGAEIKTDLGEITGLFLSREIKSRKFHEVIDEIKSQGGLVIVPHPFDTLRSSAFHVTPEYIGLIDAVEGFNSRCVLRRFNRKAVEFARQYHLPVVGGSDAHFAGEIGLAGVITGQDDTKKAILDSNLELFGELSSPFNHVRTKLRKIRSRS